MRNAIRVMAAMCCASVGLLTPTIAEARRVALVIGNADYRIGLLANAVNDAEAMAEALGKRLSFDTVLLRKNLGAEAFRETLRELAREARGAELGVVFFAGHGIETGGRNYLIPTDATLAGAADIELEAIALDTVLRQLEGVTKLRLVILDACRSSPFPAASRSVRGLGRIEPGLGTLVAYAAKDGTVAFDGKGGHSPFTAALLKRIAAPSLDVRRVFGYVSTDVMAATRGKQEPWLYGRLGGDEVYLNLQAPADPSPKPVVAAPVRPQAADIARAWVGAKDSVSIAALEAFRQQYGRHDAFYDQLAKERIDALRKHQAALSVPTEPVPKPELAVVALNPKRAATPLTAAEERGLKAKDRFKECAACPEMVVVPPGSFTMGSPAGEEGRLDNEGPPRRMTLVEPFAIGRFEVTFAEWDACTKAGGCTYRPEDEGFGRGRRPVINISWNDIAEQYLPWLSRRTGKTYRIPSEAEWEYAARAGTTTPFSTGATITTDQANFAGFFAFGKGPKGVYRKKTVNVGLFPPNSFGLYDMHGNVWEWIQDCYEDSYAPSPSDGTSTPEVAGCTRVARGGGWTAMPQLLRSAKRDAHPAGTRIKNLGFRLARAITP